MCLMRGYATKARRQEYGPSFCGLHATAMSTRVLRRVLVLVALEKKFTATSCVNCEWDLLALRIQPETVAHKTFFHFRCYTINAYCKS